MAVFAQAARSALRAALSLPSKFSTAKQKALKSAWRREANRILRNVERAEPRGYVFDFGKLNLNPPKVYSQRAVDRLKSIRGDALYEYAVRVDFETGEFVKGPEGRRQERSAAARKGAATKREKKRAPQPPAPEPPSPGREPPVPEPERLPGWPDVVIANFRLEIASVPTDEMRAFFERLLDAWVSSAGAEATADLIDEIERDDAFTWEVKYKAGAANDFAARWTEKLVDRGAMTPEQRDEYFEILEDSYGWVDTDNGDDLSDYYRGW